MQCGESPLMAACFDGHLKIVKLLIKARANVNFRTKNVCSSLLISITSKVYSQINFEYITYISQAGMSALHVAADEGHLKVVERLLEANADVNIETMVLYIKICIFKVVISCSYSLHIEWYNSSTFGQHEWT